MKLGAGPEWYTADRLETRRLQFLEVHDIFAHSVPYPDIFFILLIEVELVTTKKNEHALDLTFLCSFSPSLAKVKYLKPELFSRHYVMGYDKCFA